MKCESTSKSFIWISGDACERLEMEFNTDSVVPKIHIDEAIKFGVEFESTFPISAKRYIVAFFQKLLLQSRKLKQGFMAENLRPEVTNMWLELLSILENSNRKVLDIQSGSITFKIFCPSNRSSQQIRNDMWIQTLSQKTEELMALLGSWIQYWIRRI